MEIIKVKTSCWLLGMHIKMSDTLQKTTNKKKKIVKMGYKKIEKLKQQKAAGRAGAGKTNKRRTNGKAKSK